ncbi:MAG: hypothetical protein OXC38_02400 [Gammaproteobacteria bacterium]|nr:hypothetical protein [Gammaproteobacteria bacterium]
MLPGLTPLDLGRLRMSVGYRTHRKGRPLSPVEVGLHLKRARDAGASMNDCAHEIQLDGTGHIGRFLRILDLPDDLQHLISWGTGKDFIGFSAAVEMAKLQDSDDQRAVATSVLTDSLASREVRQVAQLRKRSGRPIDVCLQEVLNMRPTYQKHYIFIGSIVDQSAMDALCEFTQAERDSLLESCIQHIGLQKTSGRLGERFFTLVGGEEFNISLRNFGKEPFEERFRTHIAEAVEYARPQS